MAAAGTKVTLEKQQQQQQQQRQRQKQHIACASNSQQCASAFDVVQGKA